MEFKCKCKTATIYQPRFVFVFYWNAWFAEKYFVVKNRIFQMLVKEKFTSMKVCIAHSSSNLQLFFKNASSTIWVCLEYDKGLVSLLMIQNFKEIFVRLKNWWAWLSETVFLFSMAVYIYYCQFALGHI